MTDLPFSLPYPYTDFSDQVRAVLGLNQPTAALNLYVDGAGGDDKHTGLSTSQAIRTFTRLYALLPRLYERPTVVHLAPGSGAGAITYDLPGPIPYYSGAQSLWFVADEAWGTALGRTTFLTVASGTSLAGTGAAAVVSSGLTLNAHRGYSIRMTSGAAVNQYRTIRNNTTTTWTPCAPFSPAPAPGDTYEVFTNNIAIRPTGTSAMPVSAANATAGSALGLGFIGIDFDAVGVAGANGTPFSPGYLHFYGVRVRSASLGISLAGGAQAGLSSDAALDLVFGTAIAIAYAGWGLACETSLTVAGAGSAHTCAGHYVIKGSVFVTGRISASGGYFSVLSVSAAEAVVSLFGGSTTPIWIGDTADTASKITLTDGLVTLGSNTVVSMTSATNPAISCERKGLVRFAATSITGSNAHATGMSVRCRRGGRASVTGTPVFGKAGVADWQCEGTTALQSSLSSADTAIRDVLIPDSVIRREA